MNGIIKRKADSFTSNFMNAQQHCRWGGNTYAATMACILIGEDKALTAEDFRNAQMIIKENAGVFSLMRSGYAKEIVCAAVAASSDQQHAAEEIKRIHQMLKAGFPDSSKLMVAATLIYLCSDPLRYETVVTKATEIYRGMKNNHPLLLWGANVSNYVLLAMANKGTDVISRDFEDCYIANTARYRNKTACLYAAGAMCLFDGPADARAESVVAWHQALKSIRFDFTSEGLELIALLSGIFGSVDAPLINEMNELSMMLSTVKGLGNWGVGNKVRNMLSAAIVIDSLIEDENYSAFAKQVILNVLIRRLEDDDSAAASAAGCAVI